MSWPEAFVIVGVIWAVVVLAVVVLMVYVEI